MRGELLALLTILIGAVAKADDTPRKILVADGLVEAIQQAKLAPWVVLGAMLAILLVLGCFVDQVSMMLICLPFFMPLVSLYGFDPIWFGVLFVINMEIGYMTPPFGFNLFYLKGIVPPSITMKDIYTSVIPYVGVLILGMVIIMIFPLVYVIAVSFSSSQDVLGGGLVLFPANPTLDAYRAIFEGGVVNRALRVSIGLTVFGTLAQMVVTTMLAYGLSRPGVPGSRIALFITVIVASWSRRRRTTSAVRVLVLAWATDPAITGYKTLADYDWDFNAPGFSRRDSFSSRSLTVGFVSCSPRMMRSTSLVSSVS